MSILYILVPAAFLLGLFFLMAFLWATHKGQFDDLVTPAHRILFDDLEQQENQNTINRQTSGGNDA